jgi:lipid-A-disaccharide synthase-like uncharacterized protein
MWPEEAFNSAREAQNVVHLASFFHQSFFCMRKNIQLLALKQTPKKVLAQLE